VSTPDLIVITLIGLGAFFWAYADGEVICKEPWTLPPREKRWPQGQDM